MNNKIKAYLALCLVTFIWGLSFISTKVCLNWFAPLTLAFLRFFIAAIVLFFAMLATKSSFKLDKKDIIRTALLGFTGIFLYFTFENISLNLINASLASIFVSLLPAITVIADYVILRKKISRYKFISVLLSVIGAILVAGFTSGESSKNVIIGGLLILLSLTSWIIYCYLTFPIQNKYSPIKITFYQTVFGALFFAFTLPFSHSDFTGLNASGIINLVFLGTLCSAICYLLYNYCLKHLDVIVCSIFINMMPIITVSASIILLNESLTSIQYIGAALVIASVLVVTYEEKLNNSKELN